MTKNTTMSPTRLALLALGSVALLAAGCSTPVPLTIQPAGTSICERLRSRIDATPSSFMVRIMSPRRISIARATPGSPAAARP